MDIWQAIINVVRKSHIRDMTETFDGYWDKAEEMAGSRIDAVKRSRLQWDCVKLMVDPDEEKAKIFLDEIQKQNIMWREWNALPVNVKLSRSAANWQ